MSERWLIVGAGSAGCVLAARLSEDPEREVVLVEAGPGIDTDEVGADRGAEPNFFDALGTRGRTYADLLAWRTPDGVARPYQRGRGLGGSSAVNAMVALRGDPALYASWGWDDVDAAWARVAVPCELADESELGPVDRALLASSPEARRVPLTRRGRRRVDSADAYLAPALDRSNLTVLTEQVVDKVIVDRRRAVGVRLADGSSIDAEHVVLAAGAIHSPAILLRSDVDTHGLGEGLQDHPSVSFTLELRDPVAVPADALVTATVLEHDGLQLLPMNHLGSDDTVQGLGVLMAAVMRPHGRSGIVRLASRDPMVHPEVRFNLLHDPRDIDLMVDAAQARDGVVRTSCIRRGGLASACRRSGNRRRSARRRRHPAVVGDRCRRRLRARIGDVRDGSGRGSHRCGDRLRVALRVRRVGVPVDPRREHAPADDDARRAARGDVDGLG